jgi:hypothetical protein
MFRRVRTSLVLAGAVVACLLALGAGVASAHAPGRSCQSVGVTNNGGITVFYNCNVAHAAVNPPALFTTANAFLEFTNGQRCYANNTEPGPYVGAAGLCRSPTVQSWKVCVKGTVVHTNGLVSSNPDFACYGPTAKL